MLKKRFLWIDAIAKTLNQWNERPFHIFNYFVTINEKQMNLFHIIWLIRLNVGRVVAQEAFGVK